MYFIMLAARAYDAFDMMNTPSMQYVLYLYMCLCVTTFDMILAPQSEL